MKAFTLLVITVFVVCTLVGCVYTNITMPLSTELNKTELGSKKGEASSYSVIWLFAWGDAGAAAAAKDGKITVMTHMDREILSVLFGIYTRMTTVVYGD